MANSDDPGALQIAREAIQASARGYVSPRKLALARVVMELGDALPTLRRVIDDADGWPRDIAAARDTLDELAKMLESP